MSENPAPAQSTKSFRHGRASRDDADALRRCRSPLVMLGTPAAAVAVAGTAFTVTGLSVPTAGACPAALASAATPVTDAPAVTAGVCPAALASAATPVTAAPAVTAGAWPAALVSAATPVTNASPLALGDTTSTLDVVAATPLTVGLSTPLKVATWHTHSTEFTNVEDAAYAALAATIRSSLSCRALSVRSVKSAPAVKPPALFAEAVAPKTSSVATVVVAVLPELAEVPATPPESALAVLSNAPLVSSPEYSWIAMVEIVAPDQVTVTVLAPPTQFIAYQMDSATPVSVSTVTAS